uniref:Uncharacterized protein n=1 Tax=Oryza meridionalis TaxID=40149 RepID=A0A0E0CV53_9ORYZ
MSSSLFLIPPFSLSLSLPFGRPREARAGAAAPAGTEAAVAGGSLSGGGGGGADRFTSDLSQLIADVMSGSVPLDASTSIPGTVAILGVFKQDKINCSPLPTHPILQWMMNDLLTINFISYFWILDATGNELVVMMGLARELTLDGHAVSSSNDLTTSSLQC